MTDWTRRGLEGLDARPGPWEVRRCGDGDAPPICGMYPSMRVANDRLMGDGWALSARNAGAVSLVGLDATTLLRYERAGRSVIAARVLYGRDGIVQ